MLNWYKLVNKCTAGPDVKLVQVSKQMAESVEKGEVLIFRQKELT